MSTATANTVGIGRRIVLTAEEWMNCQFEGEGVPLLGTAEHPIVPLFTKNIVEAPEKAWKTTFLLRLLLGLSCGEVLFPELSVPEARKVLYLHGELNPPELKARLQDAGQGLPRPFTNFVQARDLDANLVTEIGQGIISDLVGHYKPDVLVVDPWQSFIPGVDENSAKETDAPRRFLDSLIAGHGLTVFLVMHQGKDRSRGARGSSAMAGWRDSRFQLKANGRNLTVTVEPRWAEPLSVELQFRNGTVWTKERGELSPQVNKVREFVMASGGETTRAALGLFLGLEGDALRKALQRASDAGVITVDCEHVRLRLSRELIT